MLNSYLMYKENILRREEEPAFPVRVNSSERLVAMVKSLQRRENESAAAPSYTPGFNPLHV